MMFGKIRKLYFVGIGGAGMSGIAETLHNLGFQIQGSDSTPSDITDYLQSLNIIVHAEHNPANIGHCDVVVISSAVTEDNPEVVEARRLGIPVIKRAEMLGELMRLKYSIGVAGTHGKTTTTSMIGKVLDSGDYKPTIIVGGVVAELGTGAALGSGDYLVAEADEYDRSFLSMFPTMAVVTNLEGDHLDCYDGMNDLMESFLTYMNRVPFYGSVIVSADDPNLNLLRHRITRPYKTFGFSPEADFRALNVSVARDRTRFTAYHQGSLLGDVELNVPGRHNVANALAAIGACFELDVDFKTIAEGLASFAGVGRRFETIGHAGGVTVIDDYAHHPTEIAATLSVAKEMYEGRIVVIYQPHLYSRTRDFVNELANALALADKCVLVDIYPAREEPIPGVTSKLIAERARAAGEDSFSYVGPKEKAISKSVSLARSGDVIITMGAGSITLIKHQILEELGRA